MSETLRSKALVIRGASLTVADAAVRGATVVVALLIARFFGPAEYGAYAIATSLAGLALIPTILGFEQELTRRGSLDRSGLGAAMSLTRRAILAGAVVGCVLLAVFVSVAGYSAQVALYTGLLWVSALLARLHLPFRHYSLVIGRPELCAMVQTAGTAAIVGVTVVALVLGWSLALIIVLGIAVNALLLATWWRLVPTAQRSGPGEPGQLPLFIRASLPFGISNVIWAVYFNIDSVILSLLRSDADVGIYGAAFRMVAVSYTFAYAMTNVFTPLLFSTFEARPAQYRHYGTRMLLFLAAMGVAVSGGLFAFAAPIVNIVLGAEYGGAIAVMQVLAVATFVRFINYGLSELLTTSRRQNVRLKLEGLLLVVNVAANVLLIPELGPLGAATACVIGEIVLLAASAAVFARQGLFHHARPATGR
jgi:O-antigen/teichoic acid export membrane protein